MKLTNLIYDLQSDWKVGTIPLTTNGTEMVSLESVKHALDWMSPTNISADDFVLDLQDKIPQILYDNSGQRIVLMPAGSDKEKGREKIAINSAESLATAMVLHMKARSDENMLTEKLKAGVVEALMQAKSSNKEGKADV